jgi:hypothetical protein
MLELPYFNILATDTHVVNSNVLHACTELSQSMSQNIHRLLLSPTPLLFLVSTSLILYRLILYPLLVSPLARIPRIHPLAALTPLWMDWKRLNGKEVDNIWSAFKKHGDYIRIGPSELAVNSTSGIAAVHGHGPRNLDKTTWYDFFVNHG